MTACPPWHKIVSSCMIPGAAAHLAFASKSALSWGSGASKRLKRVSSSLGVLTSSFMHGFPLEAMHCKTFTSQGMAAGAPSLLSTNCMRSRICEINTLTFSLCMRLKIQSNDAVTSTWVLEQICSHSHRYHQIATCDRNTIVCKIRSVTVLLDSIVGCVDKEELPAF